MLTGARVCVTGGGGFLGRSVVEELANYPVSNIFIPRSCQYDLTCTDGVQRMFDRADPTIVIHLAAECGGIGANQRTPGRFFYANMAMGLNLIEESRKRGIRKFIQVGSVCAYPRDCPVPFVEESLWNGYPEETNAPYGIAKRCLSVMLDAYRREYGFNGITLIPVNLYGPGDNFDPETSHVIPALIRKLSEAVEHELETVTLWGTGNVTREFLYVDDAAQAIAKAADVYNEPMPLNLGTGREISIRELAERIAMIVGCVASLQWDATMPDGQPRRCLDVTKAKKALNWTASTTLEDGLRKTVEWWKPV